MFEKEFYNILPVMIFRVPAYYMFRLLRVDYIL